LFCHGWVIGAVNITFALPLLLLMLSAILSLFLAIIVVVFGGTNLLFIVDC